MKLFNFGDIKVSIYNHRCDGSCGFYWKMNGGKGYYGAIYYFGIFKRFRLVIDTIKEDYT